ncbi:TrkA C-terminal domain-containing protein [Lysinibacillus sp. 3P01SB]|uniref:TrkA C-terminal domain-containing protein n=1 Tax=Lysinibacillus sp. 3P01SB TaxID=3132284 RepID=UPI0039A69DD5
MQIKKPKYQIIAEDIASKIVEKKYITGEKIYARSIIASQYGVSAETARRAIAMLQDLEIVEATKGSGVVITSYDNAVKFVHQNEGVQSIRELQVNIKGILEHQEAELANLHDLVSELVNRTSRFKAINPFIPYQLEITETCPFLEKTISEINFWQHTGATIVAIRKGSDLLLSPGPYAALDKGNIIYFIGDDDCLIKAEQFLKL